MEQEARAKEEGRGHQGDIHLDSSANLSAPVCTASLQCLDLPSPFPSAGLGPAARLTIPSAPLLRRTDSDASPQTRLVSLDAAPV